MGIYYYFNMPLCHIKYYIPLIYIFIYLYTYISSNIINLAISNFCVDLEF